MPYGWIALSYRRPLHGDTMAKLPSEPLQWRGRRVPSDHILDRIEHDGGSLERDEDLPGRPVVGVSISGIDDDWLTNL